MANRFKALFGKIDKEDSKPDGPYEDKDLATIDWLLIDRFGLEREEADMLFEEALSAQSEATHLMRFTRTIKDNYTEEKRIELIEMLWEVAYADGIIHSYEDNLIRRIAGLIYVSDRDRGEARKRVRERRESA